MRIAIGSDHRGHTLRLQLVRLLEQQGHQVTVADPCEGAAVDYPDVAAAVCRQVSRHEADRGILICGTGIGMSIAANKFRGVRAAAVYDEITAELSRRHNDVNVLCLSGDWQREHSVERLVDVWLTTAFEGGRHARRIDKISDSRTRCQLETFPAVAIVRSRRRRFRGNSSGLVPTLLAPRRQIGRVEMSFAAAVQDKFVGTCLSSE